MNCISRNEDWNRIDEENDWAFKKAGFSKTSLAVQKDNYAAGMYMKLGFQIEAENKDEHIMVRYL